MAYGSLPFLLLWGLEGWAKFRIITKRKDECDNDNTQNNTMVRRCYTVTETTYIIT